MRLDPFDYGKQRRWTKDRYVRITDGCGMEERSNMDLLDMMQGRRFRGELLAHLEYQTSSGNS